jgi:hypothetical protein
MMQPPRFRRAGLIVLLLLGASCAAQQTSFDVEAYRAYLASHQALSGGELRQEHAAPLFQRLLAPAPTAVRWLDSVIRIYRLTADEQALLLENGFLVTERHHFESFGGAYVQVWQRDLPVFVSTDAILHAVHMSYDAVLRTTELQLLAPRLRELLAELHGPAFIALKNRYAAVPGMTPMLRDVDLYLTVARSLLSTEQVSPVYPENLTDVQTLLSLIAAEAPSDYPLFSGVNRTIDFSQFTVRGHYTQDPLLGRYFKSMIWLGRTEFMLSKPVSDGPNQQRDEDIQRQVIDAYLLCEALSGSGAAALAEIDRTLTFLVGESDNVRALQLGTLRVETGFSAASDLLQQPVYETFRSALATKPWAQQRINSQILMSDPMNPQQLQPPAAFLLCGQRFIIDSYVFGNVTYDRILHNGEKVRRMLPSPLDALFALGNDAAAQLLRDELDRYFYAPQLAALRYLVDSYGEEFWNASLYNAWLHAIRALVPPANVDSLPPFMRTAAWQQEKMNTQLASWAQLRHDNLLYAKQSYSGGITCAFPEGYVEPYPEFYRRIAVFAHRAGQEFGTLPAMDTVVAYFTFLAGVADTLGSIAGKELSGTPLDAAEADFLHRMIFQRGAGCDIRTDGWYVKLFFVDTDASEYNAVIADVHTAPTNESGDPVGWVLHVGTGTVNLGVVIAPSSNGGLTAYTGAMMSYYQQVTTNFKRLTDEEWKKTAASVLTPRPDWINVYCANVSGNRRPPGPVVDSYTPPSGIEPRALPSTLRLVSVHPNPIAGNGAALVQFSVSASTRATVQLRVYDAAGRLVRTLLNQPMQDGVYLARWDARSDAGVPVASGAYFLRLTDGSSAATAHVTVER